MSGKNLSQHEHFTVQIWKHYLQNNHTKKKRHYLQNTIQVALLPFTCLHKMYRLVWPLYKSKSSKSVHGYLTCTVSLWMKFSNRWSFRWKLTRGTCPRWYIFPNCVQFLVMPLLMWHVDFFGGCIYIEFMKGQWYASDLIFLCYPLKIKWF